MIKSSIKKHIKIFVCFLLIFLLLFSIPFSFALNNNFSGKTNSSSSLYSHGTESTDNPTEPAIKAVTSVSGLNIKVTKKSRTILTDEINITPSQNRILYLQYYNSKNVWVTKKKITLPDTETAKIKVTYPNLWWTLTVSKFRLILNETETAEAFISKTIVVTAERCYQNPKKYVQIKNSITLNGGGYNLNTGFMGLKVKKVNKFFGIGDSHFPRYTSDTKKLVKKFQKRKKIKANGIVNKITWMKMGFSEKSWYSLGAYVSPLKVNPSSTKKQHIDAMIKRAKQYLGASYVVGASGTPSQGTDCSGLVMQALFAAGVKLSSDPVRHSKPGYEYESRKLFNNKKLKKVSLKNRKKGDLIFYQNDKKRVNHVAIYLGNNKVIEAWPNRVVIWPLRNNSRWNIKGVRRVFV